MKIKPKIKEFEIGDIVRIKSYEEVLSTIDGSRRAYDGIFFNPSMKIILDSYDTIKETSFYNNYKIYYLSNNTWTWSSEWLEHER